jgi:acetyl-CoA carboxylase carboxyl transferase subunit alpha
MATLKVPIITVVIGEGFSGGALGIGVGDRILMQEHSIYSVITPEGYASILWKDSARAREAAEAIRIIARDIHDLGVADKIIPEPLGGAHRDPEAAAELLGKALAETLDELLVLTTEELMTQRYEKFRSIGSLK